MQYLTLNIAAGKDIALTERLNNNNNINWAFKMEMFLIKEDLFEIVTSNPPNPYTTDWLKHNAQARAITYLCIEDAQIIQVKHLKAAKQVWDELKSFHQRSNLSSKLFLLSKLYSQKLSKDCEMNYHTNNVFSLKDKLFAIGE